MTTGGERDGCLEVIEIIGRRFGGDGSATVATVVYNPLKTLGRRLRDGGGESNPHTPLWRVPPLGGTHHACRGIFLPNEYPPRRATK